MYAMISILDVGRPYESKYSAYPESENRQLANANRACNAYRDMAIIEGFISVDGERSIG
jgi:hypothetical protein